MGAITKQAGRHFSFLKTAGRHQNGAGRPALLKRPRQNTAFVAKIGLRINCEKTKAMKIGPEQHPPILIMQQNVDYVEKFPYLGSYMSSDGDSEPDVRARILKAASIFQRLRPIWSSTTINLNVKLRLYTNIVIPTAIYACETWKRTAMIAHRLDVFHRRCLRAILCISWRDHVTNEEVMRRAGMERLQDIVTRRRKMAGHVLRLQREREGWEVSVGRGGEGMERGWREEGRGGREGWEAKEGGEGREGPERSRQSGHQHYVISRHRTSSGSF